MSDAGVTVLAHVHPDTDVEVTRQDGGAYVIGFGLSLSVLFHDVGDLVGLVEAIDEFLDEEQQQ